MRLETADVDRYGPLYDCRPDLSDGVTVLSGPNEAGKTLYLEALLALLEPDVASVLDGGFRVDGDPTGRVVVEHAGERYESGDGFALSEITDVDPVHLESVFVVRDSDLALPADQDYYTSLIEKLGDIHTSEIDAVTDALKDRGRLTDARMNVSSDQRHHGAGDVRDRAVALAEEIREYVADVEADGLDELESRRLRAERDRRDAESRLDAQRAAESLHEHDRLAGQLAAYREASERLDALAGFDRGTLDDLRETERDLAADRDRLDDLSEAIDEAEASIAETDDALERVEERDADLDRRANAVADADAERTAASATDAAANGAERRLALTRPLAVAGALAAGAAGGAGALTGSPLAVGLGVALLAVTVASGILYARSARRVASVEASRDAVLAAARDAGLDVEDASDVGPAVEAFERERATVRDRLTRLRTELDAERESLGDLRAERSATGDRVAQATSDLEDALASVGVESVDEYRARVEERETLSRRRGNARQSLVDAFGDVDAADPADRAAAWERRLDDVLAGVDEAAADPEAYDPEELARLESRADDLAASLASLEERLGAHDDRLDAFAERARDLDATPFVGAPVTLEARSKDGLERLAADLDAVVDRIETDAELSRKAVDVFEAIEAEEERKLTTLFEPDGTASRVFDDLTDGRYGRVGYDPDAHDVLVERRDGRTLSPRALSHGTRDQLYFATRVSLARQLLGPEPGFLLLDDPFLAADPDRLENGFRALTDLAADGWQVLYLTAKAEVYEGAVDAFDLDHVRLPERG